jgi:hypothetical protein
MSAPSPRKVKSEGQFESVVVNTNKPFGSKQFIVGRARTSVIVSSDELIAALEKGNPTPIAAGTMTRRRNAAVLLCTHRM